MTYFIKHKLIKDHDGYILELYLDQQLIEFSLEFLGIRKKGSTLEQTINFEKTAEEYIIEKLPNIKIKVAKIMLGTLLVASIPIGNVNALADTIPDSVETQTKVTTPIQTATAYIVKSGDTLYLISKKFSITVTELKEANGLKSDLINVGQQLRIPSIQKETYIVQRGDTLYLISKKFGTTVTRLKETNVLKSDLINVGQILKIPYIVSNPSSILVLANKSNNLPSSYIPRNLVVPNVAFPFQEYNEKKLMRQDAALAIEEMFRAAKADGINLYAVSGYRSYATQSSIFDLNARKYGSVEKANQFSAKPGQSEHQTGLAIDITSASMNYGLSQAFGDAKEGKWLRENAYKYGFILRYQQGKQAVTGYQYEPWHFRLVGKEAAKEITFKNITLEEYLEAK
jgi:LAS superfamily LD-carboxypeptidase LdcB